MIVGTFRGKSMPQKNEQNVFHNMQSFKFVAALLLAIVQMSTQSTARPGYVDAHGGSPDDVSIGASSLCSVITYRFKQLVSGEAQQLHSWRP